MRIQYSLSIFLSALVIVSACQGGAHRMYMDSNGSHAADTGHAKEKNHENLTSFQALAIGNPDAHTQNGNGSVLPAPFSHGAVISTAQSVQALQQHSTASAAKPDEEIVPRQDEKKEEAWQYSSDLTAWFQRFVDVVDRMEIGGDEEIMDLLKKGKEHNFLNKTIDWEGDRYTSLHYAAQEGELAVVRALIDQGGFSDVDIIAGNYQRTPLHIAAQEGKLDVVKFLIKECNANWSKEDASGSHTLHYAASGEDNAASTEVVKYLVEECKVDLHTKGSIGFNILYMAIKVNNPELVKYLVEECLILTTERCNNDTPLNFAETLGRRTIVGIIKRAVSKFGVFN